MSTAVREESQRLLQALHASTDSMDSTRRQEIREQLVLLHLPLARHVARRFINSMQPQEDLINVAVVGLITAIDAFDPAHGTELSTYAVPLMLGELRRHLRDRTWAVHVPRSAKDRALQVQQATETLTGSLGRSPTVPEIAAHLDIDAADTLIGLEAARGYGAASLDTVDPGAALEDSGGVDGRHASAATIDSLGGEDPALEAVEAHHTVRALLATLEHRERQLLVLRFWHGLSQSQIAARVGLSQMHVSRLIRGSLERLRVHAAAC